MDIFFTDPSDAPVPPNEMRIRSLTAESYPDKRRVKVYLEVTPFQKRPVGEITIQNQRGIQVAVINIIEPMENKMEFTMHLREAEPEGVYTIHATLAYTELIEEEDDSGEVVVSPKTVVIDTSEITIEI